LDGETILEIADSKKGDDDTNNPALERLWWSSHHVSITWLPFLCCNRRRRNEKDLEAPMALAFPTLSRSKVLKNVRCC
jgi:hypothetical protein